MKILYFLLCSTLLWSSCTSFRSKNYDCKHEVKSALKSLSSHISMDKKTKVYTLHYDKLPTLSKEAYRQLSDSLEEATFLPLNPVRAKEHFYYLQLEHLKNLKCSISLNDIRKYFGAESETQAIDGNVKNIVYYFNDQSTSEDCFSLHAEFGWYSRCRNLFFVFDEQLILSDFEPSGFGYDTQ